MLAAVDKNANFLTQGDEVDDSDVLAARAALSTVEFLLEFSLAYDVAYTRYHDPGPGVTAENLQDLRLASGPARAGTEGRGGGLGGGLGDAGGDAGR